MSKRRLPDTICEACCQRKALYRRGICVTCWNDKSIRELFPSMQGKSPNGLGLGKCLGESPMEPTKHLPGTPGKIRVMRNRAAMGYSLFHPLDAVGMPHAPTSYK